MPPHDAIPVAALFSGMAPAPGARLPAIESLPSIAFGNDVLLCGPDSSGRSSIALHFALHCASAFQRPVLWLCSRTHTEQSVPLLPANMDEEDPLLHQVHFKFLAGHLELQRYAACMHMLPPSAHYGAVVVEDLSALVGKTDDRNAVAKTLAMVVEGVAALRAASACACPLLVTDSFRFVGDDAKRPVFVHQRWLPVMLQLQYAGADERYCLSVLHLGGGAALDAGGLRGLLATYSVAGRCLVLEALSAAGGAGEPPPGAAPPGPAGPAAAAAAHLAQEQQQPQMRRQQQHEGAGAHGPQPFPTAFA